MAKKNYSKQQPLVDLPVAELRKRVGELKAEQFQQRLDRTTGKLQNYRLIPQTGRQLAAVLTALRAQELASAKQEGKA